MPPLDLTPWLRPGTLSLPALPPLSVYVHLPWCLRKCPYCDFNSHAWDPQAPAQGPLPEAAMREALRDSLSEQLPLVWGRPVHTVFIGGGTPSLFSPDFIAALIADLRALLPLLPGAEITLEANPGTFERDRFGAFAQAGVTRLSIGVQSFDDSLLRRIGRVHSAAQALAAAEEAARHFNTFNLDLMYALPGQSLAQLRADLNTALALQPPHLSLYHLTVEPNTAFAHRPPDDLPPDDLAFDMLDALIEGTEAASLTRYEVSAFARDGHRCRHNLNYWRFGDYLGVGPGAHGKLSFPHRISRTVQWKDPSTWLSHRRESGGDGQFMAQHHAVARQDLPFEFMLNALRLREGFESHLFTDHTGLPWTAVEAPLAQAQAQGLIEWVHADRPNTPPVVRPSARGFDWLNALVTQFLPAPKPDASAPPRPPSPAPGG